jgi:hypothetical protein
VEVAIDPSYVEQDTLDNAATRAIVVGQPMAAGFGVVSGTVTSVLGAVANATVSVIDSTGTNLGNTVTDQTGFYMMSSVPDGQTQITITPPTGYAVASPTQTVTVSDQQVAEADFTLTATNPITALKSSANPAKPSQNVTYTATVTPSTGNTATGTVTFQDGGVTIATVTLSKNVAKYKTAYSTIGVHPITAAYSGDANNPPSTSDTLTELIQGTTTTTVGTSGSPAPFSQPVMFTATVTSTYGTIPDGETVDFYDGKTLLGSGTLEGGIATYTTTALTVKNHTIKAVYEGDQTFKTSTGKATEDVEKDTTTTTLFSNLNPSTYGQTITFTAQVASSGTATPTGTVTFKDGTKTLGSETLNASGAATLATATLDVGTHAITASYKGDPQNEDSTSSALSEIVVSAQFR